MDKLLKYFNSLSKEARKDFCDSIGVSENYLRKAISKGQVLGPKLCSKIERYPGSPVTRQDLHPDDWRDIWPELAEKAEAH